MLYNKENKQAKIRHNMIVLTNVITTENILCFHSCKPTGKTNPWYQKSLNWFPLRTRGMKVASRDASKILPLGLGATYSDVFTS